MTGKLLIPSFALVRSPLLSIEKLLSQFQSDHKGPDSLLYKWLDQPVVERALLVASPTLFQVWLNWKENPKNVPGRDAQLALWRYIIRMSSRSTPFGLFAGVSVASVGDLMVGELPNNDFLEIGRPDSGWVSVLAEQLVQDPMIRRQLRYRPNNSLYSLGSQPPGGQLRYSDYTLHNGQRAFFINSVQVDEPIKAILNQARLEPKGVKGDQLIDCLTTTFGESRESATELVNELIEAHILISDLEPGVTGTSSFKRLLNQIREIVAPDDLVQRLIGIQESLTAPAASIVTDRRIEQSMRALLGDACPPGPTCQVDLVRSSENPVLNARIVQQIGKELLEITPLRTDRKPPAMATFARRFYDRYGMQPQPLLLALDHETGIGYRASPHGSSALSLLQQLVVDEPPIQSPVADRLDGLRLAKLTAFLETGQLEQAITELELTEAACTAPTNPLARSWAVLGELYGSNAGEIDAGHYQFLVKSVSGPSGAALIARFGESHPGLREHMTQLTDWEADQYPDAILAELVHLPAGRVGNVLHRPTLRAYEIPYITPASVD